MTAAFISQQPQTFGREYPLGDKQAVTLGRAPDNDIVLDSASVSRHHARVEETESGYVLQDLGSKNGTWINDQPVVVPTALHDGDTVRLGDVALAFRCYAEATMTFKAGAASWLRAGGAAAQAHELQLRELRSRLAPDGTVTILFSDIEGSTEITHRLGDRGWLDLLRTHDALFREQISAHEGFEVKTQGDGFMVAFQSAHRAVHCAIAIQQAFASYNDEHAEEPLSVRIGVHTGEAIKQADDFFGQNVILASRIAGIARGGGILVSSLLKELTESAGDLRFDEGRDVKLKGLVGTRTVYAVLY